MIKPFLFRPTPSKYETISSYIQRVAENNFIMPSDIWKVFCKRTYRYHQIYISIRLDVNPSDVFDTEKFESALFLEKGTIENMSLFSKTNSKFALSQQNMLNCTQSLNKFFITSRKYCPICLIEKAEYKLLWQINGINYCKVHNTLLKNTCYKCNKNIFLMGKSSKVGFCPSCKSALNSKDCISYAPSEKEILLHDIWNYILDENSFELKLIDGLSRDETICVKLIYLLQNSNYNNDKTRLINLFRKKDFTLELDFQYLIKMLLKLNTNLIDFINLDIPYTFIQSILNRESSLTFDPCVMAFLGPWF